MNVEINLSQLKDERFTSEIRAELENKERDIDQIRPEVVREARERIK